jgi:hypothetical protein
MRVVGSTSEDTRACRPPVCRLRSAALMGPQRASIFGGHGACAHAPSDRRRGLRASRPSNANAWRSQSGPAQACRRRPTGGHAQRRARPTKGHARREDEGSPHGEAANGNAATAAAIGRGARSGRTGGPSAWCGLTERASDLPALPKAARGGTCRRPRPRRGAGPALCQPSARSGGAQRWFGVGERRLAALSAYSG